MKGEGVKKAGVNSAKAALKSTAKASKKSPGSGKAPGHRQKSLTKVSSKTNAAAASPEIRGKGFPIVGLGASAGGLEACTELLKKLPTDTGMGFVLVQHLD